MRLFQKKAPSSQAVNFPPDQYEPVIRSSICTGEQSACMRNRETGKLYEITVIRSRKDLEDFGKEYGVDIEKMRTVY